MADLKIPNLNRNSDQYLFKKKLTLSRKSKGRLIKESFFMIILSLFFIYINYLIPNKALIFSTFSDNVNKLFDILIDLFSTLYKISIVIFTILSFVFAFILLVGATLRIFKVYNRKTTKINFK